MKHLIALIIRYPLITPVVNVIAVGLTIYYMGWYSIIAFISVIIISMAVGHYLVNKR